MDAPVYIQLEIQNMAASEMLQNIPPDMLEEIKRTDPHPVFEAYKVAHPGESKSYIVGLGTKVLKWFGNILETIKGKIKSGIPVFYLHGKDNSHGGRQPIGRIVATVQNFADEVVSIVYRFKDFLHLDTDIASFEAPLHINEDESLQGHEVQPHELGDITGLALANSAEAKPAFARATKTAYMQCLTKEKKMSDDIKLEDVLGFIEEKKIKPSQLFDDDTIMEVEAVKQEIASRKGNDNLYNENLRLKAQLATEREKNETLKAEYDEKIKERDTKITATELEKAFDTELTKREKLTDKQKEYLKKKKASLQPKEGVEIETTLNSYFDEQIKEFDELQKYFNETGNNGKETEPKPKQSGKEPVIADNDFIPA